MPGTVPGGSSLLPDPSSILESPPLLKMQPPGLCFISLETGKTGVKIQGEEENTEKAAFGLKVGRPVTSSGSTSLACISHFPSHILCVSMCEYVCMCVLQVA